MSNLIRKTLTAETVENFTFDNAGYEFIVKNFTEGDIYVSLEGKTAKADMEKIPSFCAGSLIHNKAAGKYLSGNAVKTLKVIAVCAGEVEIKNIDYAVM